MKNNQENPEKFESQYEFKFSIFQIFKDLIFGILILILAIVVISMASVYLPNY